MRASGPCDGGGVGRELPAGTITFLFTDIEGSTSLWEQHGEDMRESLARHDELLRAAVEARGGTVFKHTGDGVAAAFPDAGDAVLAAVEAQRALGAARWGPTGPLRVRMGLHTGEAEPERGDYFAPAVNLAARLEDAAAGGHVVVSAVTWAAAQPVAGSNGFEVEDLGRHQLRGIADPTTLLHLRADGLASGTPLRVAPRPAGNVPARVDPLIGRDDEVARLAAELRPGALLTVTGPGGVGKTSLALAAAHRAANRFEGGAWVAELAEVSDEPGVLDAITSGLELGGTGGVADLLARLRRGEPRLLVLDNGEHVAEPLGRLLGELRSACPDVAVVVTSRERLAIEGERVRPLDPLALEAEVEQRPAPAVALFLARAADAGSALEAVDERTIGEVGELCRRLDGLPLAIELAAARSRTASPAELLARLDERFALLGGDATGAARHDTLRATIDWSFRLLGDGPQQAFTWLATFAGSFRAADAEVLLAGTGGASPVVDLLAELVDRSMLVARPGDPETRFTMLESLRAFGRARLAEAGQGDEVRRRHAHWLVERLTELQRSVGTRAERAAHRAWRDLVGDLRAAHAWAVEVGDARLATALVASGVHLLLSDGLMEGTSLGEQTLAVGPIDDLPGASAVYAVAAHAAAADGDRARMEERALAGLACASGDTPLATSWLYNSLVNQAYRSGRADEGRAFADEWLEWSGSHPAWAAPPRAVCALMALYSDDRARAEALSSEALRLAQAAGSETPLAFAHFAVAEVASEHDGDVALAHYREATRLSRAAGSQLDRTEHFALTGEAALLARRGEAAAALDGFQRALEYGRWAGMADANRTVLRNLLELLALGGDDLTVAELQGHLDARGGAAATERQRRSLGPVEERLGPEWAIATSRGARLSTAEATGAALDAIARARARLGA